MARNRFEQYISNPYVSQFVPTPLDTNMMYNVLKEKQGYYDQLIAANANLAPQFNYIKPNDYDMGHQKEAMDIQNYYSDVTSNVAKMLQEDNLEGAKNAMMQALYNKDMKKRIQYLEGAYNQDLANLKSFEDIKNLGDRRLAIHQYQQNRLQNRSFEDYYAGKANALSSPILGQNPNLDEKVNKIGAAIQSNGYTFADGSVLQRAVDAQGNPTGKYIYRTGDITSEIDQERALGIIYSGVLSDPEVQDYIQARDAWGSPILSYDENGVPNGGPLMQMIQSQAFARAHMKSNQRAHYTDDGIFMHNYKTKVDQNGGHYERGPIVKNTVDTPGIAIDKSSAESRGNNSLFFDEETGKWMKTKQQYRTEQTLNGSIQVKSGFTYEEADAPKEVQDIKDNYSHVTYIDPQGNRRTSYVKTNDLQSFVNQGNVIEDTTEVNDKDAAAIFNTQTLGNREYFPQVYQYGEKVNQKAVNNLAINDSFKYREVGEDGTNSYEFKSLAGFANSMKEMVSKGKVYKTNAAVDVPGVETGSPGYRVIFDGREYELYGDDYDRSMNYEYQTIEEINKFDRDRTQDKAYIPYKLGNEDVYIYLDRSSVIDRTGNQFMYNDQSSNNKVYLVKASNEKEAKQKVKEGKMQEAGNTTDFKSAIFNGTLNN